MIGLLIDTATERGSVALYKDDKLLYTTSFGDKLSHLRTLYSSIEKLLKETRLLLQDTDYFGVDIGPGSFTGIRIGVTTARTLSQLCQRPLFGAVSLDILSRKVSSYPGLLVPVLDGKKNSLYTAFYSFEKKGLKRVSEYLDITPEQLVTRLDAFQDSFPKILFLGDGQKKYREILERTSMKKEFTGPEYFFPEAEHINSLKDKEGLTCDYEKVRPFYLRRSDAEVLHKPTCSS